jgi:hypothetical protein
MPYLRKFSATSLPHDTTMTMPARLYIPR